MKKMYQERSSEGVLQRAQRAVLNGRAQLLAGLGGVLVILLCSLLGFFYGDVLNEGDIDQAYHPPHYSLAQWILYTSDVELTTDEAADADLWSGDLWDETPEDDAPGTRAVPVIQSEPVVVGQVGEAYQYELRFSSREASVAVQLLQSPRGMAFDQQTASVKWTPEANQLGQHIVELVARDGEGTSTRQRYTLTVSNDYYALGTDRQGRSMAYALILGFRWALFPGLVAVMVALSLGVVLGGYAGYTEGVASAMLSYVTLLTESVPALILLFLAAVISGFSLFWTMVAVGIIRFPAVASSIKGKVESLKAQQFVEASRELGLRDTTILWRDIIWYNARPLLLLHTVYCLAFAVIVEVTLSYLRLGIQVPEVSWGNMIYEGRVRLVSHAEFAPVLLPGLAILITVSVFYLLGDAVKRRLNIQEV
jgi:peptide/nickel transport system permease protein